MFRNESYMIRKYHIVAFQNCFSSWDFPLYRNAKLVFIEMSSENLQKNETDIFQRPIPEMNRLKFPKYDLILPFYSG